MTDRTAFTDSVNEICNKKMFQHRKGWTANLL